MAMLLLRQVISSSNVVTATREISPFLNNYGVWLASTRNASKKAGGSSRNAKGRPRGKSRGLKKEDGDWVTQGSILVRQLGLEFLPGLNVGIGRDRTLYAKYHGRVMITTEKVDPDWDHKIVKRFKGLIQQDEGAPIYKTYLHILTEPQKSNFKLVDQI